jgi:thiamine-phosphate pyrophosphorylase
MPTGASAPPPASSAFGNRRLYLCTSDRPDLAEFLRACIAGGVDVIQLRDKQLEARELLGRAEVALEVCRSAGVPFILNDRPDLALAVGADGVHVGQDDCPAAVARRILGPEAVIGLSTHAPAELDAAAAEPIDYLSTGPVFATATHPDRAPTGLDYLRYAAERCRRPWFVTGNANPATVGGMVAAGATQFVVVRHLTLAPDPEAAAREMRHAIDSALGND